MPKPDMIDKMCQQIEAKEDAVHKAVEIAVRGDDLETARLLLIPDSILTAAKAVCCVAVVLDTWLKGKQ